MKKLTLEIVLFIAAVMFLFSAFWSAATAQSKQVNAMVGYKALELSAAYVAPNELIFGLAVSATDTEMTEKRANRNDRGTTHDFNGDYTPAAFGLIGGQFEELSIIGKLGASYVDQAINGEQTKDLYFAVGIAFDYKVKEDLSFRVSYDNVAGPMAGLTLHF